MFDVIRATMPFLVEGLWVTIQISFIVIVIGSLIGFAVGMTRAEKIPVLSLLFGGYIHALRGTPFLVHLYVVYFLLPSTKISWLEFEAFTGAIIALSLYTSTYVAEVVRAAIEAVPRGQTEAARSVGMTKPQCLQHIVLPQAVKMMIPPMGGIYVIIIKGTSIVSVIGISELVRAGEHAAQRHPSFLLVIYGLVALMYFLYCYPMLRLTRWAESRLGKVDVSI